MSNLKGTERENFIQTLARTSDEALDAAYGYGTAQPGTFGYAANVSGASEVLALMENGERDIEVLADASHEGWANTARTYEDPVYQTKPEKRTKRLELAATSYYDLPDEEQEKDRVAVRALLNEYVRNF